MASVIGRVGRSGSGTAKIPLRLKVKAWWDGVDLSVSDNEAGVAVPETTAAGESSAQLKDWETDRVRLLQDLWGSGFSSPGGDRFVQKLLESFGLDESTAVLDLGAGLGGTTRAMARTYGARTTGLEADEALARAGMELSRSARMSNSAPITPFNADEFVAKRNAYDCIFSKEFMFTVKEKLPLLAALRDSLTDSGQLQIIDYVAAREDLKSDWLDQWTRLDWTTPFLWSFSRYTDAFENFGFRVLMGHDISDDIYGLVSQSLSQYMAHIQKNPKDPRMLEAMAREVHIWESRMKLLKENDVRICRFHVKKKPGQS